MRHTTAATAQWLMRGFIHWKGCRLSSRQCIHRLVVSPNFSCDEPQQWRQLFSNTRDTKNKHVFNKQTTNGRESFGQNRLHFATTKTVLQHQQVHMTNHDEATNYWNYFLSFGLGLISSSATACTKMLFVAWGLACSTPCDQS